MDEKIEQTISVLCEWVQERCEKGASDKELEVLSEVIEAVSNLIRVLPYHN